MNRATWVNSDQGEEGAAFPLIKLVLSTLWLLSKSSAWKALGDAVEDRNT